MPTQLQAVTSNPRLRKNNIADLNARLDKLPQMLANKAAETQNAAQKDYWTNDIDIRKQESAATEANRAATLALTRQDMANTEANRASNLDLANRTYDFNKKQAKMAMGLEGLKFGANILTSGAGRGTTVGGLTSGVGNMFSGKSDMGVFPETPGAVNRAYGLAPVQVAAPTTFGGNAANFVKNINVGNMIGSGLAGWGASQLVGNKSKGKKMLFGAGAGALAGLLSGGGNNWNNAISGSLFGTAGSLFG